VTAELACDGEVLHHYPEERQAYASALVETLERGQAAWQDPALGTARAVGWSARELTQRLERILDQGLQHRPAFGIRVAVAACLLLSLPGVAAPGMSRFTAWLPSIPNGISDSRAEEMLRTADLRLSEDPQDGPGLNGRGRALIALGRYVEAAETFEQQGVLGHRPANASYNRACALALAGKSTDAIESLNRALTLGIPLEFVEHDKDFMSLRPLPEFQALLAR
jgi:tetratricopeptide (TPR) repeat protein